MLINKPIKSGVFAIDYGGDILRGHYLPMYNIVRIRYVDFWNVSDPIASSYLCDWALFTIGLGAER